MMCAKPDLLMVLGNQEVLPMSRVSIVASVGQWIAAAVVLGAVTNVALPAAAQSSAADQTCRPALGDRFSVASGMPDRRCCLVVEEMDWYRANDVTGGRVYVRVDALKVRPMACSAAELAALRTSPGPGAGPDVGEVPKKKRPFVQPQSLLYGTGDGGGGGGGGTPFRDVFY
jgi:hypothetical protein